MRRDFEPKGLVVAAFNAMEDARKIRAYLEKHEFRFKVLVKDAQDGRSEFGLRAGGSAVLIGADGRVVWRSGLHDPAGMRKAVDDAVRPPK